MRGVVAGEHEMDDHDRLEGGGSETHVDNVDFIHWVDGMAWSSSSSSSAVAADGGAAAASAGRVGSRSGGGGGDGGFASNGAVDGAGYGVLPASLKQEFVRSPTQYVVDVAVSCC